MTKFELQPFKTAFEQSTVPKSNLCKLGDWNKSCLDTSIIVLWLEV